MPLQTWMSQSVQGETLFHSDKITHFVEWGLQISSVQSRQGPRYEERLTFHLNSDKEMGGKSEKQGRNKAVLHRRIERAGFGDIHINEKYDESWSRQLFLVQTFAGSRK